MDSIETLESRQLLTNLVAVSVHGNSVSLNDVTRGRVSTGDNFSITYTSNSVTLTGTNGTSFKVGGQTLTTYTANLSGTPSLSMNLNAQGNTVSITGDGTTSLSSIDVRLGAGRQNNSLTLTKVVANSLSVNGGRHDNKVTLNGSTINGNVVVNLGSLAGDVLDLESSTIKGNVRDQVGQLIMNQSTINGTLNNVESGKHSVFTTTDSTFTGAAVISMGRDGVVNMQSSTSGSNHFHGALTISGVRRHEITVNQQANSVVTDVTPKYSHVNLNSSSTTIKTPTVNTVKITNNTPTITGTYDSVNAPNLTVVANNTSYVLGSNSHLTSPSSGTWSLDLTGSPLPAGSTTVTVTSSNSKGNTSNGTGTVTVINTPAVNSLTSVINTPTITGTYDAVNGSKLTVAVNGTTYTLGTSSQLTAPSAGQWSLNLSGATALPSGSTTVTVTSSDANGDTATGTGTVTTNAQTNSELATIHSFETKNNLTATQTNSGLNYVIETKGTGAVPTKGQTVSVNYTGHLLNSNATQGTEFDSNVDSQFGHVTPFQFTLGNGQVIPGWDEAFALLPVGTVAKLIIPSALAYGSKGSGSTIPANSVLIFDITLVSAA